MAKKRKPKAPVSPKTDALARRIADLKKRIEALEASQAGRLVQG